MGSNLNGHKVSFIFANYYLIVRMNSFSVLYNYEGFGTVYGYVWSNPVVLVNQKGVIPYSYYVLLIINCWVLLLL